MRDISILLTAGVFGVPVDSQNTLLMDQKKDVPAAGMIFSFFFPDGSGDKKNTGRDHKFLIKYHPYSHGWGIRRLEGE